MKFLNICTFGFLLLALASLETRAQDEDAPPPPPRQILKKIGDAKVYRSTDGVNATVGGTIFGDEKESYESDNDGIYVRNDVIYMYLQFDSKGPNVVRPGYVDLRIAISYSRTSKFRGDHKLTIFGDGHQVLSRNLITSPDARDNPGLANLQLPDFTYSEFLELASAKIVTFQIGQNKFDLKPETLRGFRDLNSLISR